uniref:sodium-dependent dopamine transporter-like n=1 Tax=Myxine glutinosa TaxID=7769 RepID=UPI00358F3445
MYLFQLIEGQILFFIFPFNILIELVVIFWIYGTKRLCANVKEMTGQKPGLCFQICWRFLTPCILMAIILSKIILYKTVRYGEYTYPSWALVFLGWMTTIFILIWLPLGMVHTLTRTTGTFWQRLVKSIEPTVSAVTRSNELNLESQEQPTEDLYPHNSGGVPG